MVPGPVLVDVVARGSEGFPPPDRSDYKGHPVEQAPEEGSGTEG